MKEKTLEELIERYEILNRQLNKIWFYIKDRNNFYQLLDYEINERLGGLKLKPLPPEVQAEIKNMPPEKIAEFLASHPAPHEPRSMRLPNNIEKDFIEIFYKIIKIKKELKDRLSNYSQIKVGGELANKLKNIREDKNYFIYSFLRKFEKEIGKKYELDKILEIDFYDKLELYSLWDYIDDFVDRKLKIGPIITGKELPDIILHNMYNVRECFSLGLFEASIIYCRAIIESAVNDFLVDQRKIDIHPDGYYDLGKNMKYLEKYLHGNIIYFDIKKIIGIANSILHKRSFIQELSFDETAQHINTTIKFIEHLYSRKNK